MKNPLIKPAELKKPSGGGSIQGIGETFQPNLFSGTGSYSIPIAITTARGFEPSLQLNYNSGSGNGPWGLGFSLSQSSVSRRTENGIPKYDDSDIFLLSGIELVPSLTEQNGAQTKMIRTESIDNDSWQVQSFQPRVVTNFDIIEYWVNNDNRISYWKVIARDNTTTLFGLTETARMADPADPSKIFEWLPEQSCDDKGNKINHHYKKETDGVASYISSIQYGNYGGSEAPPFFFELVFDYGERDVSDNDLAQKNCNPYKPENNWYTRLDPFTSCKSGFEIQQRRLCKHLLLFHHLNEPGSTPCLVKRYSFQYVETAVVTTMKVFETTGCRRNEDGSYQILKVPPLEFTFAGFHPPEEPTFKQLPVNEAILPGYLNASGFLPVDLYGEGLPGFLFSNDDTSMYLEPLGNGAYKTPTVLDPFPVTKDLQEGAATLIDLEGNKKLSLMVSPQSTQAGYYPLTAGQQWDAFQPFTAFPTDLIDPDMEQSGLSGNGRTDALLVDNNSIHVYPSLGKKGYDKVMEVSAPDEFPMIKKGYQEELVTFADLLGDGLPHRIRITDKSVECWPNLGYGKFGQKRTLNNAPAYPDGLNNARLFLADLDGSGTTDLIYVYHDRIEYFINQSGNSFADGVTVLLPDDFGNIDTIHFADINGRGATAMVLTKIGEQPHHYYYEFTGVTASKDGLLQDVIKPYLLVAADNNRGSSIHFQYASSVKFYLEDKEAGKPWITQLPFPVQVVEQVTWYDEIAGSKLVNKYKYHEGYYDGVEKEFRGFGFVESWDTETFEHFTQNNRRSAIPVQDIPEALYVAPVYTKSWHYTGANDVDGAIREHYKKQYYQGDDKAYDFPASVFEGIDPDNPETVRQAFVALKGQVIRQEVYGLDNSDLSNNPYTVSESNSKVTCIQPKWDLPFAVFTVTPRESISYQYERNPHDPRIQQSFSEADAFDNIKNTCTVYLGRRNQEHVYPEQQLIKSTATHTDFFNHVGNDWCRIGVEYQQKEFECTGLNQPVNNYFSWKYIKDNIFSAMDTPVQMEINPMLVLQSWSKIFFWNDKQDAVLPLGEIAPRALVHHQQEAVFTTALIDELLGDLLPDNMLQKKGGYFKEDNYWWNGGLVQYYQKPEAFCLPYETQVYMTGSEVRSRTTVKYDDLNFRPVSIQQWLNDTDYNETSALFDYDLFQYKQIRDINDNVLQVLFDPLDQVIVQSLFKIIQGKQTGGMRLYAEGNITAQYQLRTTGYSGGPITFDDVINHQEYYLQGAAHFFYYDLFAWMNAGQPLNAIDLQRNRYQYEDGKESGFSCQTVIVYSDGAGRLLESKLLAEDAKWETSGRTVYNNKGKPCEQYLPFFSNNPYYEKPVIKPLVPPTTLYYDPVLRVIKTVNPDKYFSMITFTPWEEKHYDEDDTDVHSPFYNTPSTSVYNVMQQAFLTIEDNQGQYLTAYHTFDIQGRETVAIDPRLYYSNINHNTTYTNFKYTYGLTGKDPLCTESADAGKEYHINNIMGNLFWSLSARRFNQLITYDWLQRRKTVAVKGLDANKQILSDNLVEVYTYGETQAGAKDSNLRGALYELKDQSGIVLCTRYELQGELLETSRQLTHAYKQAVNWRPPYPLLDPTIYATSFTFDALKRLLTETTPDGTVTSYGYNQRGLLMSVAVQYKDAIDIQPVITGIEYNANKMRTRISYANGSQTTYLYEDTTLRLLQLRTTRTITKKEQRSIDNKPLQDIAYTYDPVGNILSVEDRSYESVFNNNQQVDPVSVYTYDALYRLKTATGRQHPGINASTFINNKTAGDFKQSKYYALPNDSNKLENYTQLFTYDDAGNLLSTRHQAAHGWSRSIETEADSNRIYKINTDDGINREQYMEYDRSGNQKLLDLNNTVNLTWSCCENLIKASIIERPEELDDCDYYTYDSEEMRVRKVSERMTHGGAVTEVEEKIYLGNYEEKITKRVGDKGEVVTLHRQTLRVMDDKTCVAIIHYWVVDKDKTGERQTRFQLGNNIGSVSMEIDSSAQLISYEEYFPYGGTSFIAGRNQSEVSLKDYRYSGKERDDSTGLYYYGARYYAPWLGRWLSPDPAGRVDGMNLFAFVKGNPIIFYDRTGKAKDQINEPEKKEKGPDNAKRISYVSIFLQLGVDLKRDSTIEWLEAMPKNETNIQPPTKAVTQFKTSPGYTPFNITSSTKYLSLIEQFSNPKNILFVEKMFTVGSGVFGGYGAMFGLFSAAESMKKDGVNFANAANFIGNGFYGKESLHYFNAGLLSNDKTTFGKKLAQGARTGRPADVFKAAAAIYKGDYIIAAMFLSLGLANHIEYAHLKHAMIHNNVKDVHHSRDMYLPKFMKNVKPWHARMFALGLAAVSDPQKLGEALVRIGSMATGRYFDNKEK